MPNCSTNILRPLPSGLTDIRWRCSAENVPFQKKCASSGSIPLPSIQRFNLYSRPIFSSETGMYRSIAAAQESPQP